ncbi:hypothetical protein H0I25_13995 [Cellulophaga sp. HaHa_2_95]|uniref:PD-(D/E)XK nuclease domain-containing protein n=1 Tax=Cellulophaga sp. HaHa_2_95 TaxID=2745558 RepID=UPI001C4E7643|nr:hypothetical protein [Cellulophaga sp. HaHa_2_95]QXP55184.1 hypothetical protein H0I25_13995 [Cellulophaga sp. HaHa_2_95]
MREFDFLEFHNNIQKDFSDVASVIISIERVEWNRVHWPNNYDDGYYDEQYELDKARLVEILNGIKLKFEFAYEILNLVNMSLKLESQLKKHLDKFDQLDFIHFVDVFYSPAQWIFRQHLEAITSHIKIGTENDYEDTYSKRLLEQILRGTPKMIYDRALEPSKESEVQSEVYKTLIHVFPDTVREIPIAKISKTYKPDIGIKQLKSAIEYKFVDSAKEAKTSIGGIFEDIQGYEGSEDWTTFYAVIYMTDNYLTVDQVEAEFKLSKVPHNWKPIVVYGKGSRNK